MNRREVLAGAGLALTTPLAGCSSIGGNETTSDTPSSPKEYPYTVGGITNFHPERTVETIEIGSREGVDGGVPPHYVDIWKKGDVPAIELRVVGCNLFDCIQSATTIEVRSNGALPSRMVTTLIACSSTPC